MQIRGTFFSVGCTLLAVILVLLALRVAGSMNNDYSHWEGARFAVAQSIIQGYESSPDFLYIGFEDRDPFPEELASLSAFNQRLRIRPYSERTDAEDWCGKPGTEFHPCKKDNFLIVSFQAMLLWRTAVVRWRTTACSGTYLAVLAFGKWRVVQEPSQFCR